jgi:hypothetical protein
MLNGSFRPSELEKFSPFESAIIETFLVSLLAESAPQDRYEIRGLHASA